MYTPETLAEIDRIRSKILDGTATEAEITRGIQILRSDRHAAVEAASRKSSRSSVAKIDVESLLEGL